MKIKFNGFFKFKFYVLDFPSHNTRRLSGITMSSASIASLAKSTPSISTDLLNERPMSFTVLPNSSHDTYQHSIPLVASPYKPTLSCSSLANFTWSPTTTTLTPQQHHPPTISSVLSNSLRQSFGDPNAIKPIVSGFEYPRVPPVKVPSYKIPSPPIKSPLATALLAKSENPTLERYNKFVEKQKMQLELQLQQQQADFLSLSLSPPISRRNKEMMALKGSFVSL